MVMMMEKLDELTERLEAVGSNAGAVRHRGQDSDPKQTLNTGTQQHTMMTTVNPDTHLVMNTERVRGHRQGIRAVKGKENRAHKTVAHKNTVKTMMNKTAKQHTHSTGIQNRS